jgi:4-amino-4-deoxy-L-arabinose transferase-like glycosyltransferase
VSTSRLWLAFVLALFCLPLFVGLGRTDVGHDEAIYSFSVDRILEAGDWLEPKSSPSNTAVFLEKPPLKFWIVAAPIRLGLLPHSEFGIRFWDAAFGSAAFLYTFAIGTLLAGPVCGAVAVLILFVHWPLLFDHGLRSNNMEAALVLSYCGGVFHFLRWAASERVGHERMHAALAGLYFVLGFMTKFVAVAFLPIFLGACALLTPSYRRKLLREWRLWAGVAGLVLAMAAPWFVYAYVRFGRFLWDTMLGEHVYARFTAYLDPTHLQPWHYYVVNMYERFGDSGSAWLVIAGLLLLLVQTVRRRWPEGAVVLAWCVLPILMISFGTSKLYHYAYPFLPPFALAAGYLVALAIMLLPAPLRRVLERVEDAGARTPGLSALAARPWFRSLASVVIVVAALLAIASIVYGQVRLGSPSAVLFKNSGALRPVVVILVFAVLAGYGGRVSRLVVVLLVCSVLPAAAYRDTFPRLTLEKHPMRSAVECLQRVGADARGEMAGLYVDVPDSVLWHPINYYFRRVQPWTRATGKDAGTLDRYLNNPSASRPILIYEPHYQAFARIREAAGGRTASPAMMRMPDSLLLLPGPYAACSTEGSVPPVR